MIDTRENTELSIEELESEVAAELPEREDMWGFSFTSYHQVALQGNLAICSSNVFQGGAAGNLIVIVGR